MESPTCIQGHKTISFSHNILCSIISFLTVCETVSNRTQLIPVVIIFVNIIVFTVLFLSDNIYMKVFKLVKVILIYLLFVQIQLWLFRSKVQIKLFKITHQWRDLLIFLYKYFFFVSFFLRIAYVECVFFSGGVCLVSFGSVEAYEGQTLPATPAEVHQ